MKLLVSFAIAILSFTGYCQQTIDAPDTATSTYFLIRHTEKDLSDSTNRNPDLTKKGVQRANNWAKILKDVPVDLVFSTDYIRTMKTASPIAKSKNLDIIKYDPKKLNNSDFQKITKGKTIVIVGHSNTTPLFVNKIIGQEKFSPLSEDDYGKLFIIKVTGTTITETVLNFN